MQMIEARAFKESYIGVVIKDVGCALDYLHCLYFYVWKIMEEKTPSTFCHGSWESRHVDLIIFSDLAGDVN